MEKKNAFDLIMKEYSDKGKDKKDNLNVKKTLSINNNHWFSALENSILIYNPFNISFNENITKILSFDLDSTLISTKSGKTFARNENDWRLFNDKIPEVLSPFISKEIAFVIFSNQSGLSNKSTNEREFKHKIEKVINLFNNFQIQFICLFATNKGYFRKPSIGMFEYLQENYFPSLRLGDCLYVGDAAGRENDFSDSDYKFTLNVGIKFQTPEFFFCNENEKLPILINQKDKYKLSDNAFIDNINNKIIKWQKIHPLHIIILVGSPGSGKSSFYFNYLEKKGYLRVNNDDSTPKKAFSLFTSYLGEGKLVVVDNTNNTVPIREKIITFAKQKNYGVYCFYLNYDKETVFYLNKFRLLLESFYYYKHKKSSLHSKSVPDVAVHSFYKNLVEPSEDEGINEIEKINFVAGPFQDENQEKLFYFYQSKK